MILLLAIALSLCITGIICSWIYFMERVNEILKGE